MVAYAVEDLQEVTIDIAGSEGRLAHYDLMSPFVWTEGEKYRLLVRVLPNPLGPSDPTGVIWGGISEDGRCFRMHDAPAITPGPSRDDGCVTRGLEIRTCRTR